MAAAVTESTVPDVADSLTPEPRRASTAPTEEGSESGVGLNEPTGKQTYHQPPPAEEDDDEGEEDEEMEYAAPGDRDSPTRPATGADEEDEPAASPTTEYLSGIMAEFRKLEGKLSSLLSEHSKVKDENEELRSQPPAPDPDTLQELETLTTKYNKVKKLYFQREQQVEDLTKENDALKGDTDDMIKELDALKGENTELNRDLEVLVKERETLNDEYQDIVKERDSLVRQRDAIARERDAIARERDAVLRERDTISRVKEEAIHDKQEALIERDEAKQDRETLQNRVKDLEDDVAKLQASANGVRDKRQSAPPSNHSSGDAGYPQEILRLKYDKVKRLYYDQQKVIAQLEDRLRSAEPKADEYVPSTRPESMVSRSNSKGKQRASYVSPDRDSYRGESTKFGSIDTPPQRRRSVRTGRQRGGSLERDRLSADGDIV